MVRGTLRRDPDLTAHLHMENLHTVNQGLFYMKKNYADMNQSHFSISCRESLH